MLRYLLEVDVPNEDGADLVCTVPQIPVYQVEILKKKPVSLKKRGRQVGRFSQTTATPSSIVDHMMPLL
jgi:hypothetical protein